MGATLAVAGTAQAATLTVTNLDDSGDGSLRQAILDANQDGPGSDDIVFASGLSGTIDVGSSTDAGLYPSSAMTVEGAEQITLRLANPGLDYVVYTGTSDVYGAKPGDPITLSGLTIAGGHAADNTFRYDGGGIYNGEAALTLSNAVISGNNAEDDGGGIFSYSGSLSIVNSTLSGNSASDGADPSAYGGAIYSYDSPVLIRNSTISGNTSGGVGGAIYMSARGDVDPSLTVENSTIANNTATLPDEAGGGGVSLCCGDDGQHLEIRGSTISGNSVGGDNTRGGGVYANTYYAPDPANQVSIQSTIVANNTAPTGNDLFLANGGQVGFSLIEDPANSTNPTFSLTNTGPNILSLDPQLGSLSSNGGPTQTEAPASVSPVIDKGAALGVTTDQRGVQRPIDFPAIANATGGDGSDIGAFELQPDNAIRLGTLRRNPARGTARQIVKVPLPGAGTLTLSGKGLTPRSRSVTGSGRVKLPVIPSGAKRRLERITGRVRLKAKITYRPTGNATKSLKRRLTLRKR
jgi:hypothetical protein